MSEAREKQLTGVIVCAFLLFLLFAIVGLLKLAGLDDIELIFNKTEIESTSGVIIWCLLSFSLAGIFAVFLNRRLRNNNREYKKH